MNAARESHTATLLPFGGVIIAGGNTGNTGGYTPLAIVRIYDPLGNVFNTVPVSLSVPRAGHAASLTFSRRRKSCSAEAEHPSPSLATADVYNVNIVAITTVSDGAAPRAHGSITAVQWKGSGGRRHQWR